MNRLHAGILRCFACMLGLCGMVSNLFSISPVPEAYADSGYDLLFNAIAVESDYTWGTEAEPAYDVPWWEPAAPIMPAYEPEPEPAPEPTWTWGTTAEPAYDIPVWEPEAPVMEGPDSRTIVSYVSEGLADNLGNLGMGVHGFGTVSGIACDLSGQPWAGAGADYACGEMGDSLITTHRQLSWESGSNFAGFGDLCEYIAFMNTFQMVDSDGHIYYCVDDAALQSKADDLYRKYPYSLRIMNATNHREAGIEGSTLGVRGYRYNADGELAYVSSENILNPDVVAKQEAEDQNLLGDAVKQGFKTAWGQQVEKGVAEAGYQRGYDQATTQGLDPEDAAEQGAKKSEKWTKRLSVVNTVVAVGEGVNQIVADANTLNETAQIQQDVDVEERLSTAYLNGYNSCEIPEDLNLTDEEKEAVKREAGRQALAEEAEREEQRQEEARRREEQQNQEG